MIQLVISDTNILIDLHTADLLDYFFSLPFEVHTTDFVLDEIERTDQKDSIHEILHGGRLIVDSIFPEQMPEMISLQVGNLSLTDCSVWFYARTTGAILLTGDGRLKKKAQEDGIQVHGILFVFDELVRLGLIQSTSAATRLETLANYNNRLPKEEVDRRLQEWKSKA